MDLHRRDFLTRTALATGGLVISVALPSLLRGPGSAEAATPTGLAPNAFVQIGSDNTITLIMPHTEVGQGIYTSAATLVAEELEVGLDQVTLLAAPPDNAKYADPFLGEQATGGSTSIRADWQRLRAAGAAARMMLIEAAAQRWRVQPASCRAALGVVYNDAGKHQATYGQLADAAGKLAVPDKPALKQPAEWRLIGKPLKRIDTPSKVNGTAVFGIDVKVPGMKIGTVAASPVIGGTVKSFDEAAARKVPGVVDVVKLNDAVAVIGDHMWAAKQGLEALSVQWNPGANAGVSTEHLIQALDAASLGPKGVVAKDENNAPAAIKGAKTQLSAIYQLPFLSHAPMEPINCTVHVRPDGCDVWVGTQVPVRAQQTAAEVTGLPPEKVTIHNYLMGGAFGRRLDIDSVTQAVALAKQVSYPVKFIWTREEDIQHDLFRPYYYDRVSAGLDTNGKLVGWTHRVTGSSVLARWAPGFFKLKGDFDAIECAAETPYEVPAAFVDYIQAEPQGVTTAWWRGVGPTHNVFVVESFVDECALAAGKDPIEFRRAMLEKNPRALAVLNLAAEKSGWGSKLPPGVGRGVSLQFAFGSYVAHILEVEVTASSEIKLRRSVVAIDCGQRVNPDTIEAQIQGGVIFGLTAAMYSEIHHKDGRVVQNNFNDYRMLRIDEAPKIEVYQVESSDAPGGIGETGTAAAAAALGNAIHAATGKRLRTLPFGNGALVSA
jgi:isoquinoline 1-oxidoreductase beta subunit